MGRNRTNRFARSQPRNGGGGRSNMSQSSFGSRFQQSNGNKQSKNGFRSSPTKMKAKVYHYNDSSEDERPQANWKQNRNAQRYKSAPPKSPGSDTCTFETMEDSKVYNLFNQERKTTQQAVKQIGVASRVTYPMDNLGNTCFFNSVMQCLSHTLPLHKFCMSQEHVKQCKRPSQSCYQCRYVAFVADLAKNKRTDPAPIVRSLPAIWSGYRIGQQRDAHEFLTLYMEAILNSSFHEKPSRVHVIKNQTQTPLFKIFGGKLRSQIRCEKCDYRSDTFDETFTFNLPLPRGKECTFTEALDQFFQIDRLTKDNKYMCPVCKSLQNATKRLSVTHAPNVLVVTIKRFDMFGHKITKNIRYPVKFDMKNFTSSHIDQASQLKKSSKQNGGNASTSTIPKTKHVQNEIYDLYGVVIHKGSSTNSGHYFAYCKAATNNAWYECNDSYIGGMSEESALNKEAYLLFYQKRVTQPKVQPETPSVVNQKPEKATITQASQIEETTKINENPKLQQISGSSASQQLLNNQNESATTANSSNTNMSNKDTPKEAQAQAQVQTSKRFLPEENNVEMTDFQAKKTTTQPVPTNVWSSSSEDEVPLPISSNSLQSGKAKKTAQNNQPQQLSSQQQTIAPTLSASFSSKPTAATSAAPEKRSKHESNFSMFASTAPLPQDSIILAARSNMSKQADLSKVSQNSAESIGDLKKLAEKQHSKRNKVALSKKFIKLKRDLHPMIVNSKTRKRKREAFQSLERMSAESSPESAKYKNHYQSSQQSRQTASASMDLTSAFNPVSYNRKNKRILR